MVIHDDWMRTGDTTMTVDTSSWDENCQVRAQNIERGSLATWRVRSSKSHRFFGLGWVGVRAIFTYITYTNPFYILLYIYKIITV